MKFNIIFFFIIFTLYPAYSRVGGNVVLRHSIGLISANLSRHCVSSVRTQRRALPRHQTDNNENINLNKYFIMPSYAQY